MVDSFPGASWTNTMPTGQDDSNNKSDESKPSDRHALQVGNNSRQWLKLPAPIKQIFDQFPLQTYPANKLPQRTAIARDTHSLYIFATEDGAKHGTPSSNPACLKWQTYLKFQNIDFQCVASSNHASPTGALPFLLPAVSGPDIPLAISSNRIQRWARDDKAVKNSKEHGNRNLADQRKSKNPGDDISRGEKNYQEHSSTMRYDAYMSLISHKIRNAYLYSLYLSPLNFNAVAYPLYIAPTTTNSLVRLALSHQLRATAEAELLKETVVIDVQSLHRDSEQAFSALSTLLGDDEYFFGDIEPSLFDASVFAYTNILLDEDLNWQIRHLNEALEKHGNLVRHRARILHQYFPAKA